MDIDSVVYAGIIHLTLVTCDKNTGKQSPINPNLEGFNYDRKHIYTTMSEFIIKRRLHYDSILLSRLKQCDINPMWWDRYDGCLGEFLWSSKVSWSLTYSTGKLQRWANGGYSKFTKFQVYCHLDTSTIEFCLMQLLTSPPHPPFISCVRRLYF